MSWIVALILDALKGTLLQYLNDWRRDFKLEDLGYAKRDAEVAKAGLDDNRKADDIRAAVYRDRTSTDWLHEPSDQK